jgi:hypothetical protein
MNIPVTLSLLLSVATITTLTTSAVRADDAQTLRSDLDRDGKAELFQLRDDGESLTTLTISVSGKPAISVVGMAWSLEPATLSRATNGSILLHTSHIGIGRSPHEQTLTIAYRSGAYQVVGITRSNWDRIEPDKSTRCDINLLTGRGKINGRDVRRNTRAIPVTQWTWDRTLPAGCFIP